VKRTPFAVALEGARVADDLGVEVAADYGDPAGEERALWQGAGVVDRCARGAVAVTGPDALSFLHSLLSQDVNGLADGEGVHSLLLSPQGKLDVDLRLLRVGDEGWLDCEVGRGEQLAASLTRFKIRVKAEVEDRSGAWGCLAVRGPRAAEVVEQASGLTVPEEAHAHVAPGPGVSPKGPGPGVSPTTWGELRVVRADWPGVPGVDVVGTLESLEGAWGELVGAGAVRAGLTAYEAVRVAAGVPRQGRDLDERTIPQEAFLDLDAVSFTKGCFLGQELVCRIDTRGHVNRYLRRLDLAGDARPPAGAEVVWEGKGVGNLSSVAASTAGTVALGYLRKEVELPAEVLLRWDGGEATATASALPGRP
jgi:tRNA-modifying protein YgfZ